MPINSRTRALLGFIDNQNLIMQNPTSFIIKKERGFLHLLRKNIVSMKEVRTNAEILVESALEKLKGKNLKRLSGEERHLTRSLVDIAYSYIERIKHSIASHHAQRLEAMALSGKLGGRVSPATLLSSSFQTYSTLLKVNHLQHKMQALDHQAEGATLFISGKGQVPWQRIAQLPLFDHLRRKVGYRFTYQGEEVFQTDLQLKLQQGYTYHHEGIVAYDPVRSCSILPYDKRDPQEWGNRHVLEIWTSIDYKESPLFVRGDHAYLVLKDNCGNLFGAGRFVRFLQTPDPYLLFPKEHRTYRKTEIPLDKETFDFFLKQIQKDKLKLNGIINKCIQYVYSLALMLGKNCTYYLKDLLQKRGIHIGTEISPPMILFKKLCPSSWWEPLTRGVARLKTTLPSPLAKGLYFFPPWYFCIVLFGTTRFFLNLALPSNLAYIKPMDLFDSVFRPWRVKMDHPLGLAAWQDEHSKIR